MRQLTTLQGIEAYSPPEDQGVGYAEFLRKLYR